MTDYRSRIIEVATAEIGPQGKGSLRVEAYWRDVLPADWSDAQVHLYAKTRDWCGGFALWCLRQAGLAVNVHWKDGLGFLYRLPQTRAPSRGDIGYLAQPFQHHLLFNFEHNGKVHSIDGNQPGVRERTRPRQGMTFYSIQPLVDAATHRPSVIRAVDEIDMPEGGFARGQKYSVPGIQDPKKEP